MFVNERWCNSGHITVKEQICSEDINILAVSMRPYCNNHLQLFTQIRKSTNAKHALMFMYRYGSRLQQDISEWLVCLNNVSLFVCVVTVTTM